MAEVTQLHIWIMDKARKWTEPEVLVKKKRKGEIRMEPRPGKRLVIEVPPGATTTHMKIQAAEALRPWVNKIEYYYIVAVVEKGDGSPGFRTIVPKTVVS